MEQGQPVNEKEHSPVDSPNPGEAHSNVEKEKQTQSSLSEPQPEGVVGSLYRRFDSLLRWFLLGMLCLLLIGHWENKQIQKKPWSRGVIIWDEQLIKELLTKISDGTDFKKLLVIPDVQISNQNNEFLVELLKKLELGKEENIPALTYPVFVWMDSMEDFLPMLSSGRLPEPGKYEALAGDLSPVVPLQIHNTTYNIVGTLSRDYSPFVGAYVIPSESIDDIPDTIVPGLAFPDAVTIFSNLHGETKGNLKDIDYMEGISSLQARTSDLFSIGTAISLLIICIALKEIFKLLYRRLASPPTPVIGPLFSEIQQRNKLFRFVNTFFYMVFFINLFTALYEPETHRLIIYYITHVFSKGDLQYIGEAYEQGDILRAAITTFHNNFWVQTFLLTFLISIPPLMLGVFKNLASFAFAGYAMSPIWSGTAVRLTFHSITIVLELEAYILAIFAVVLWTYYFWNAVFTRRQFRQKICKGFRVIISAIIITGCILAIAGLYEAITIILFSSY
ncbi:MAG: hypothetical protein ACP5KS_00675 [Candidatus Hydrogenedens sp.]